MGKAGLKTLAVLAAVATLAGCSTPPPPEGPAPPAGGGTADLCHAARYQHLVGRPRSEIPPPDPADVRRIACTTCPVTMDFNPRRLNIFFDAETGIVKQVRCG
jgi:hypothetical protein